MAQQLYAEVVGGAVAQVVDLPDGVTPAMAFGVALAASFVACDAAVEQGWVHDGQAFAPPAPLAPSPAAVKSALAADLDAQAEAQRVRYITPGSGQAMVYLQKQTQAAQALADPSPTAARYALLAAEVGVTVDPSTGSPAADVVGVARAVAATVQAWLPIAAAIEKARLAAKAAVAAAATVEAARAAHGAVAWPGA